MSARRVVLRGLAGLCLLGAATAGVGLPVGAQEASEEDAFALPTSYLEGFGWWSKLQQNPAGGGNPQPPVPVGTNCVPTDVNACPVGPPADGMYVVHDYEAVAPTTVTGPVSNVPVPALPPAPPGAPLPNPSTPAPLGPTAYSAVKYVVPEGAETQLALRILSRNTTQPGGPEADPSVGKLYACLVSEPGWAAVQNGRYDQGPKYDCTTADEGEIQGDVLVFELGAQFVSNGAVDVVIVGTGERPFQLALAPPSDSDLTVLSSSEASEELLSEDFTFEDPALEFLEDSAAAADLSSGDFGAGDLFVTEDSFGALVGAPTAATRGAGVGRPSQLVTPTAAVLNPFRRDASRGERLMAVALLLALGAGLWWVGGQPVRMPRLLGSLGAAAGATDEPAGPQPTNRGIGRFARPRPQGPSPRLF